MTLAERFDTWAQKHEQRGIEKGVEKGEALALQKLLTKRFGPLPPDALSKIAAASAEQLDTWMDRVLDAPTLGDIFSED